MIKQQAITRANDDPDVCRHISPLAHNSSGPKYKYVSWWVGNYVIYGFNNDLSSINFQANA